MRLLKGYPARSTIRSATMKIDLYAIDIGGGHLAPAHAIKRQFDLMHYPDLEVRVVNLGRALRMRVLSLIYKTYWNLCLRYPPLVNAFYRGADNPFLMKILDRVFGTAYLPRFAAYLLKERPDVVVSTYFTFTHFLETLKHVDQLNAAGVVLNPEPFDSHLVWFSTALDYNMVFSERSRDEIVEKGIPAHRVKLFPFPINPEFRRRTTPAARLRGRLGLAEEPFTVLLFFGAEGRGPAKKYLAEIAARKLDVQVVVICGKNARLLADLEDEARRNLGGARLAVRGFVANVPDYIAAADIVVGKSGPNQVFETLLQERPIVISSFLANEQRTSDWVISNGVGWLCRTPHQFGELLVRLMADRRILRAYRANIRRLGLRSGAAEICEFLYDLARKHAGKPRRPRGLERLREVAREIGRTSRTRTVVRRAARKAARTVARTVRRARPAARRRRRPTGS
jgi:UDP-N-acetylglucosamine:LPS N-acetylglucosamine transferase